MKSPRLLSVICLVFLSGMASIIGQTPTIGAMEVTHPLVWKYQWKDGNRANTIGSVRNNNSLPTPLAVLPPGGYSPKDISNAYGYNLIPAVGNGAGKTIAVIDPYGSPNLQTDLNTFCTQFGIPTNSVQIAYPKGQPTSNNSGWAAETTLDVEWAHAMAPGAKILLIVSPDASETSVGACIQYAVTKGANVVSMSFGTPEAYYVGYDPSSFWNSQIASTSVAFVASAGDYGDPNGVEWPAACVNVLGVGGTSLQYNSGNQTVTSETVWNDTNGIYAGSATGGGISSYQSRPNFQDAWNTSSMRGVPDVSSVADPYTGAYIYFTDPVTGIGGWQVVGGTSWSAPQWAGLLACRASLGKPISTINGYLYSQATDPNSINYSDSFRDITVGNNIINGFGFSAAVGYDYCTGLGSPNANVIANPSVVPPPIIPIPPILQQWGDNGLLLPIPAAATNPGVAAISKGIWTDASAVLTTSGKIVVWGGWSNYSLTNIPSAVSSGASAISMGSYHMLALKNGGVYAWGSDAEGQTDVPSEATNGIVAISAGNWNSLALTTNGTIVAWGLYYTNPAAIIESTIARINANTIYDPVVGISDGSEQGLALLKSGTLQAWGWSFKGGTLSTHSAQDDIPFGLNGVVAISEGANFAMALKSDGTVVAWGVGPGTNVPAGLKYVIAISAGNDHGLALKNDGTVVAWGDNSELQSIVPAGLTKVKAVEAGAWSSLSSTEGVGDSQTSGGGGSGGGGGGGGSGGRVPGIPRTPSGGTGSGGSSSGSSGGARTSTGGASGGSGASRGSGTSRH